MDQMQRLLAVVRGDRSADLVFLNARIVNTFTGEIESGNVAVAEGRIAGVGTYTDGAEVIDLLGRYLAPGFIVGHVHVESSYLHVDQCARAVVPHGTLACASDLHEVTNVAGLEGMRYIMECAHDLPFDLFVMAPPCVPATHMETSGATLGPADIQATMQWPGIGGLGEVMNFPAVIRGDDDALAKIAAAGAVTGSLPLPIAGLLSPEPLEWVADRLEQLESQVSTLGCALPSPFSALSLVALPVIPQLKTSDKGLVDVMAGRLLAPNADTARTSPRDDQGTTRAD